MADTKITALTSISTGTDPANDVFPIVDISDTTMAATGTTKKVTTNQLLGAGGTASFATLAVSGLSTLADNVVMASGKGIDFSATSHAGTMTSEILADYEEGTWSPTPSGVNLTSIVSVSARYTKVGRLVTVSGEVTATVTSSNTFTSFYLPSLPFAQGTVTTGSIQEDANRTIGCVQVSGNTIYGQFPVASAIVSGAATFYYSVTYSV